MRLTPAEHALLVAVRKARQACLRGGDVEPPIAATRAVMRAAAAAIAEPAIPTEGT